MIKFCPSAIIRTQVQQFRLSLQYIQIIHYSFSISSFPFFSGACSIFHPHILPPITTATDIAIIMISCIDNHPPYFPVTVPRAVVFSHAVEQCIDWKNADINEKFKEKMHLVDRTKKTASPESAAKQ